MRHVKEIATAVGTLAIAVGIGFVMQSSEAAKERYGESARPVSAPEPSEDYLSGDASADILLEVQEIELTSATEVKPVSLPKAESEVERASAPTSAMTLQVADAPTVFDKCSISVDAQSADAALVVLSLHAPCAVNERLTIHHNGMMFTETTDLTGKLTVTVPALSEQAVFIMAFPNGEGAVAQLRVPELAQYSRTTLQWRGRAGFELHAREFGAEYGQDGHIWSGMDQDKDGMTKGENGYVMRLGDASLAEEPLIAEVYTFPSSASEKSGTIKLSVEAEVTADNCGLEVEAQALEMAEGNRLKTQDLTLAVPGCDAVGSFLVLNNLVADLKVASN
ncbi:MAG: hypothetical protein AAFQ58_12620 [Pseudomonadota bacterium]